MRTSCRGWLTPGEDDLLPGTSSTSLRTERFIQGVLHFSRLTPLWCCVKHGSLSMAKMLVEAGAELDVMAKHKSGVETSALCAAVTWGKKGLVDYLIKEVILDHLVLSCTASTREQMSTWGMTLRWWRAPRARCFPATAPLPFDSMCSRGNISASCYAGARVDSVDSRGYSALMWASFNGQVKPFISPQSPSSRWKR